VCRYDESRYEQRTAQKKSLANDDQLKSEGPAFLFSSHYSMSCCGVLVLPIDSTACNDNNNTGLLVLERV